MAAVASRLDDDEQVRMTAGERAVWASSVAVVVASAAYLALLVPRALSQPVAEISWVEPMLWTIGSAVVSAVVLAIVVTVNVFLFFVYWLPAVTGPAAPSPPEPRTELTTSALEATGP